MSYNPFQEGLPPKEEDSTKTDKPDPTEELKTQLEEERKLREEAERKAQLEREKDKAAYEGRLEQLGTLLTEQYNEKRRQQNGDSPAPPDDITDADFDKSPSQATKAAVKREVTDAVKQVHEYYTGMFQNLSAQTFDAQMGALKSKRFYKYVENDINKFFAENPNARYSPKAAETIYTQFTGGDRIEELLELERQDKERIQREQESLTDGGPGSSRPRPPVIDSPRTPPPRVPNAPTNALPQLDEATAEHIKTMQNYGVYDNTSWEAGVRDFLNWQKTIGAAPRQDLPSNLREAK